MASASIRASFKVLGVEELIATMNDWKKAVRKRVIYNAVRKCGPIVSRNIKSLVPTETGTLKKSIGHKVYTHRNGEGAGVVIGPRKGYRRRVVVRTSGKLRGRFRALRKNESATKTRKRDPVSYAHLVEHGTAYGVTPRLPVTRGWQRSRGQIAATIRATLQAGIEKEAAKAAARNRGKGAR